MELSYFFLRRLGDEGPQAVGGNRDQIVQRLGPVPVSQRHGQEHEVSGLGVAEYAAPDGVGEGSEAAPRRHQQRVNLPFFALQIGGEPGF